jgi:glycosyltransferase involved in cell wall biosynthesis
MSKRPPLTLAAVLIVRDEEANIEACLQALRPLVDEIHVHDTGSTDSTPELAAELGARVTRGTWNQDFAAARNAAMERCSAEWVLSVDADEVVRADRRTLRRLLRTTSADMLGVAITSPEDGGHQLNHRAVRLFRPRAARWQGRVHEQVVGRGPGARTAQADSDVIGIDHHGYDSQEMVGAKCVRNADLARLALADLAAQGETGDRREAARHMVDLGRSLTGTGQLQEAVEAFEAVRELFPGTAEWFDATDFLAKILMGAGMVEVCLALVLDLREAGALPDYCNWIEAHCHAKLGRPDTALALIADLTEVVDFAGRRQDPALLAQARRELDEAVTQSKLDEAIAAAVG